MTLKKSTDKIDEVSEVNEISKVSNEDIKTELTKPTAELAKPTKIKHKFGFILWTIVFSLIIFSSWFFFSTFAHYFSDKKPIYIAVAGPMSGKDEINGQAMVRGVQLYLDKLNQQGGIDDRPVKLLVFDDQNQPKVAEQKALEIANDSEALAVIGHYASSSSMAAASIYKQHGVPAISGSATANELTQDNDWYFRTIFNNSEQGAFLANYVHKVLNYDDAYILFDEDAYGSSLAAAFVQNSKDIGLKIKQQWHFNSDSTFTERLAELTQTLSRSPNEKHLLFLATHSTEAVETAVALKPLENIQVQIVGADAVSSTNFIQKLQQYPQEQIQPGYYSDGIYTAFPVLFDIAGKRAQDFRHAFFKKHQSNIMITSALYYDTTLLVINAVRKMLKQQTTSLVEKRRIIKDNLWQLAKVENAIEGITGFLYFDKNGDAVKSIAVGIYKYGRAVAAMHQFQPMQSVDNVDNLLQEMLENRIVEVNGKFVSLAQVVYVGIDFSDISELDTKDSAFTADLYLWFRFKGTFDDANIELVNLLKPQKLPLGEPISVWHSSTEKGVSTRTYRIKTEFKLDLDFRKFPLDRQVLPIYLRHNKLTKNKLIYVVDTQGMNLTQKDAHAPKKFFSIGGWYVNNVSFFQNTKALDSTLGITDFFGTQQRIESSQFNANLMISRDIVSFLLKTFLPVIFLITLGYVSFFINTFSAKLGIGTNLILATSLFHLKLVSELPDIGYLVLIEYFFYLVYCLAIFIIIIAVLSHFYEECESERGKKIVHRLNILGKVLYPVILISFVGMIVYQNYNVIMGIT
ncbi:ABC transporter substrate-binding protein [Candidatus Halobeggiatoa sp. HSG11]|nr:ABC transporter substrate-binding protein [Candidatus Halobeggiatoa sp. HSG11]